MVALPPKRRVFLTSDAGLKSKPIPAPEGVSLVTSHLYIRFSVFFENVNKDPNFLNPVGLEAAFKKALEAYYPFTGRLIPTTNGRYIVDNFDKGALFEVALSTDDFQVWKKSKFSYTVVPHEEFSPIKEYVGRDSPLLGVRFTYLPCGSCVFTVNAHHKLTDGVFVTQFLAHFAGISRGETYDPDDVYVYTDRMRTPVKPLKGVDHTSLYPSYEPGTAPPFDIKLVPTKKLIFDFDREALAEYKNKIVAQSGDPNLKLSRFDVLIALIHKAIIRARGGEPDSCSDLVYIVGQHHHHPDINMWNYFGNYIIPVPIAYKAKDVLDKHVYEVANDIHQAGRAISTPYMESLEYYINNSEHVDWIESPAAQLGRGAVGVSDWSRFVSNFDGGGGHYDTLRSFVDASPIPLITIMPPKENTLEVIIQFDIEGFDRLIKDPELMAFVQNIY